GGEFFGAGFTNARGGSGDNGDLIHACKIGRWGRNIKRYGSIGRRMKKYSIRSFGVMKRFFAYAQNDKCA
ncbi:MAG TPA: hypothetical protein PLQ40_05070, partial [Ferruginibacter sp.]|nr:hypothetical protein [Ferruginibacter sp.]